MPYTLNNLIELVKAMSGAEKRHFSLFASAFYSKGNPSLYFQLFQVLCLPKIELSESLKKNPHLKETAVKNRLFSNILKSLRLFHQNQSVEISIQNYLAEVEMLMGLSLPDQGFFILKKAYKMAVLFEKFQLLLQILEWERKLNIVMDRQSRSVNKIAKEEKIVLEKLTQIIELENIYGKIRDIKRHQGTVKGTQRKSVEAKSIRLDIMKSYDLLSSENAKFYYDFIYTIYYWMTNDHQKAYSHSKNLLNCSHKIILPGEYLDAILEHATSCIQIGKFKEALNLLNRSTEFIKTQKLNQIPSFDTKVFFYQSGYQLVIYGYMGSVTLLLETIHNLELQFENYEAKLPLEAKQVLLGNLMNAYVGTGNFESAEKLCYQLMNGNSKSIRKEIYDDLYLFRLFLLIQNNIYEVIPNIALSAHRYYKKNKNEGAVFTVELAITSLLLKGNDFQNVRLKKKVFFSIKQILLNYISVINPEKLFQEHYSFYFIWIESIIENKPFHEIAHQWHYEFNKKNLI